MMRRTGHQHPRQSACAAPTEHSADLHEQGLFNTEDGGVLGDRVELPQERLTAVFKDDAVLTPPS